MLRVGLTGGIGSGKTTVSNAFAQLNVPIIDADLIAHQLTVPGEPGHTAIVAKFGASICNADNTIDRKQLRKLVFAEPELRHWLEKLLHPLIKQSIDEHTQRLNYPYCVIVIPLLIEARTFDLIDRILVVETSEELRLERTILRDSTTKENVLAIINAQASSVERLAAADDVIYNDQNLEHLVTQVEQLNEFYLKLTRLT